MTDAWKPKQRSLPASPIEGMSALEYQIFAQQAALEAFELGLTKRTPQNSAKASRLANKSGEWDAE